MKQNGKDAAYFRYSDDASGFARTKAEAVRAMRKFQKLTSEEGLVVKANAFVSRIGKNISDDEKRERKKKRKRQRGGRWKKHRLSGILFHANEHQDKEIH